MPRFRLRFSLAVPSPRPSSGRSPPTSPRPPRPKSPLRQGTSPSYHWHDDHYRLRHGHGWNADDPQVRRRAEGHLQRHNRHPRGDRGLLPRRATISTLGLEGLGNWQEVSRVVHPFRTSGDRARGDVTMTHGRNRVRRPNCPAYCWRVERGCSDEPLHDANGVGWQKPSPAVALHRRQYRLDGLRLWREPHFCQRRCDVRLPRVGEPHRVRNREALRGESSQNGSLIKAAAQSERCRQRQPNGVLGDQRVWDQALERALRSRNPFLTPSKAFRPQQRGVVFHVYASRRNLYGYGELCCCWDDSYFHSGEGVCTHYHGFLTMSHSVGECIGGYRDLDLAPTTRD